MRKRDEMIFLIIGFHLCLAQQTTAPNEAEMSKWKMIVNHFLRLENDPSTNQAFTDLEKEGYGSVKVLPKVEVVNGRKYDYLLEGIINKVQHLKDSISKSDHTIKHTWSLEINEKQVMNGKVGSSLKSRQKLKDTIGLANKMKSHTSGKNYVSVNFGSMKADLKNKHQEISDFIREKGERKKTYFNVIVPMGFIGSVNYGMKDASKELSEVILSIDEWVGRNQTTNEPLPISFVHKWEQVGEDKQKFIEDKLKEGDVEGRKKFDKSKFRLVFVAYIKGSGTNGYDIEWFGRLFANSYIKSECVNDINKNMEKASGKGIELEKVLKEIWDFTSRESKKCPVREYDKEFAERLVLHAKGKVGVDLRLYAQVAGDNRLTDEYVDCAEFVYQMMTDLGTPSLHKRVKNGMPSGNCTDQYNWMNLTDVYVIETNPLNVKKGDIIYWGSNANSLGHVGIAAEDNNGTYIPIVHSGVSGCLCWKIKDEEFPASFKVNNPKYKWIPTDQTFKDRKECDDYCLKTMKYSISEYPRYILANGNSKDGVLKFYASRKKLKK